MRRFRYILSGLLLVVASSVMAQESDRDCIRMGNKYFREQNYSKAETYYRKALEKNESLEALYNLGNALTFQHSDSLAFQNYHKALEQMAETKEKKAWVYHNMGNLAYLNGRLLMKANNPDAMKAFQQAVECYKGALRCNPNDDETRYNLAMAQYMLKKNEDNQGQDNQQNDQQQNQDQNNQDQNKDQKDKDQQDQNQDKQNDKEQDNKEQDKQDQNQQNQNQQNQDQQQSEDQHGQMDDRTAEQLLNSAQQDEKAVQNKVQKAEKAHRRGLEKDW